MTRLALAGPPDRRNLAAWLASLSPARRDRLADAGIGVMLAVVNVVSLLAYRSQLHPLWLALALVIVQGAALAWRRDSPLAVMIAVGAARVAYDRIGFAFAPFPLGPAIAFYTVFDRSARRWRWLTAILAAVGLSISLTSAGDRSEPYQAIFQGLIFLTAGAAGLASRASRGRLDTARGRADRAEAELDRQAARAAALERVRIARELHDVVAHHVSLIAVQAEAVASLLPDGPPQARRSADIISQTARQALTELRRLLGVLRGPAEQPPTSPAASLADLPALLDQVTVAGLATELEVRGTPEPMSPGVELTAYRIVQEALTNALRHSGAGHAMVTLAYEPGFVTVAVTDSGQSGEAQSGQAQTGETQSGAAETRSARTRVAETRGAETGAAETRSARTRVAETRGAETGAAETGAAETKGAETRAEGTAGPVPVSAGFGLAGIAERVASCGGSLSVGPVRSGGFAVTARLPAR